MQINQEARAAAGERKRARTRARLIEAAMRVVAHKGPLCSVSDIVAAAGLSRGAFYNYFPTTRDLVDAVGASIAQTLDREIAAASLHIEDPAEQIGRACLISIEATRRDPLWGWVRLSLDGVATPPSPAVRQRFHALFGAAVAQGRLRQCDPTAALAFAVGAIRMASRMSLTPDAPAELAAETTRMILVGLGLAPADADAILARARRDGLA